LASPTFRLSPILSLTDILSPWVNTDSHLDPVIENCLTAYELQAAGGLCLPEFLVFVRWQFRQDRETVTCDVSNGLARLFGDLAIEFRLGHGFASPLKKQSDHPSFRAVAQKVKPPHCRGRTNFERFINYQRFPDRHS
jgi:hypothetical protein